MHTFEKKNMFTYNKKNCFNYTFQVTLCRIGDKCVVDPSAEEECCSAVSVVVGITGTPKNYLNGPESDKIPDVEGKCTTIGMNGSGSVRRTTLNGAIELAV